MRRRGGFSQEKMAEKMHMSRSNISKLESGKLDVRARDLINWARQTDAQDMLVALVMNVDVATVADVLTQLTDVATIFLGGFAW